MKQIIERTGNCVRGKFQASLSAPTLSDLEDVIALHETLEQLQAMVSYHLSKFSNQIEFKNSNFDLAIIS